MNTQWIIVAVGIMVGTYLVRALPFWIGDISGFSPHLRRFLGVVPAAALGALIAPDAFGTVSVALTLLVLAIAIGLTLRGVQLTLVVAIAIAVTWGGVLLGL